MDPKEVIGCHGNSSHGKACYTQNESEWAGLPNYVKNIDESL